MYDEVIKKILEYLDKNLLSSQTCPKLSGKGYKAHQIDVKNFHQIKIQDSNKKISFVDGGSAEIIGSANFSLSVIRVCYAAYQSNKKINAGKFEVLAFVHAINQDNEIHYKSAFFRTKNSIDLGEVSFSSFDPTLMSGRNRAEIGSVANAIRRFAELRLARSIADERAADIIVLDGNLQSTLTNENKYINELYDSCIKNNVILTALSKTTSLFTEEGNLLSAALDNISSIPLWYYHPVAEIDSINHRAEMFFAKFHKSSKHIFRLEIFKEQKAKAEETIGTLAGNCTDPVFIGYPYGLVEADKAARVSNHEKDSLKTMFLLRLGNKDIVKYLSSSNAHEILDSIS